MSQSPQRIAALDVARGIAILGILIANLTAFSTPQFGAPPKGFSDPSKDLIEPIIAAIAAGKFRSALAVLFGYGLALQFFSAERKWAKEAVPDAQMDQSFWPNPYFRRMLFLFALGLIHGIFIWFGDILATYAVVGTVAALMIRIEERKWMWLIYGSLALGLCCGGAMFAVPSGLGGGPGSSAEFWPLGWNNELATFGGRNYLHQAGARAILYPFFLMGIVLFMMPSLLSLFGIGILFARRKFFEAPSQHPKLVKSLLWIGLGIGIPLNAAALFVPAKIHEASQSMFWELVAGPILAIGWLTAVAVWVEKGKGRWITGVFAQVGKFALSNYILQSILCTTFFYGWGFGQFGKLPLSQQVWVIPAVWTINIIFSYLWGRNHDLGPVEWIWRSAVAKQKLPWRRLQVDPVPVP